MVNELLAGLYKVSYKHRYFILGLLIATGVTVGILTLITGTTGVWVALGVALANSAIDAVLGVLTTQSFESAVEVI